MLTNTNVMNCKVFQITYELKVTCMTLNGSKSSEVSFPITLGSVPLSFDDTFQPIPSLANAPSCIGKSL